MRWKNYLIKALLWIVNPKTTRSQHASFVSKSFLIVTTTALGDTLWSTPALKALRQSFPESTISVLTSSIGGSVLKHNKHIDEIFELNPVSFFSLLRFFPKLKKRNFDAILVFHVSQRILLPFCALLEPTLLIGTAGINKGLDFLFTKILPKKRQHEIERRLAIVAEVGAHISSFHLEMPLHKEDEEKALKFLEGHAIPSHIPLVGLHPGAKNLFKQWPKKHFIEVGKKLSQHLGCQIFVSGNHLEAPLVLEIASKIPGAIPIAGELHLCTFAALLKKMMLFITNDTGPMHIAFAMQTPTIAMFGPTDPDLCGPFHVKNAKILKARKTCYPCLKKNCQDPFCLLAISPNMVYDAALESISIPSFSGYC